MKVNQRGLDLIKHFESLHDGDLTKIGLQPKMCPAGIWTIGYGHAMRHPTQNRFLKGAGEKALAYQLNFVQSEADAEKLLAADLLQYGATVLRMVKRRDLSEEQFGALVSFCYNCGTHYRDKQGKMQPFAIWKHIDDRTPPAALQQYWDSSVVKCGGKILTGLVRRRKAEAHLYNTGSLKFNW